MPDLGPLVELAAPIARGHRGRRPRFAYPAAQAEERLRKAIGGVRREDLEGQTWALRKVGGKVLDVIESVTLARFREEGQTEGGISIARTGAVVGETIDGFVLDTLANKVAALTMLVAGISLLVCLGAAAGIRQLGR